MRVRNVKNKNEILKESDSVILDYKKYCGKWNKVFGNNHPIYLEIGPGKCRHLYMQAKRNPHLNFIGLEQNASIVAIALSKMEEKLDNLILINANANEIDTIFDHEISLLYLNFSDPWPKKRHTKRRLTSSIFLDKYDHIFKDRCYIFQKTDNMNLFEYSLMSYSEKGYKIKDISLDYHKREDENNIMTEYEEKFSKKGQPIYMVKVEK